MGHLLKLIFDLDDATENRVQRDPPVDVAVIVADLILPVADGRNEVREVAAFDFAKNRVADAHILGRSHRGIGALLPVADARRHRVAAFAEGDGFPGAQAGDVSIASDERGNRGRGGRSFFRAARGFPLHFVGALFHGNDSLKF